MKREQNLPWHTVTSASESPTEPQTQTTELITNAQPGITRRPPENITDYRYKHLHDANVFFHATPPPDIGIIIDKIVSPTPSRDRQVKLQEISNSFYARCITLAQDAHDEADWRELIQSMITFLIDSKLTFVRESNWRMELKPEMPQPNVRFDFAKITAPAQQGKKGQDETSSLLKRQMQNENDGPITLNNTFHSPNTAPLISTITTPSPDITLGIKNEALISEIATQMSLSGSDRRSVERFLNYLDESTDKEGNDKEPVLIMRPMENEGLVFPFAAVECKAYATGSPIFAAQNQAAGSGACGLNQQRSVNELVKRVTDLDVSSEHPIFFSICTEGPIHELWVHYMFPHTHSFNMKLLKTYNGLLPEQAEAFVIAADNVFRWGVDEFLKSVSQRLGEIFKATTEATA